MLFEHLATYGKRSSDDEVPIVTIVSETRVAYLANIIDLRSGATTGKLATIDLAYAADGRVLRRIGSKLHVVHPTGASVEVAFDDLSVDPAWFVGSSLVARDDRRGKKDLGVWDTSTGRLRGRLQGHAATRDDGISPWVVVHGEQLWTNDGAHIRCWDPAELTVKTQMAAPADQEFVMLALLASGHPVTLQRGKRKKGRDALVVLDLAGKPLASVAVSGSSLVSVGSAVVLYDDDNTLRVFDEHLTEQQRLPLPKKEDDAELLALWSGQEWLALGGFGQFHHYGPAGLRPSGANEPTAAKPSKKSAKR
jgi:hypothetical protein